MPSYLPNDFYLRAALEHPGVVLSWSEPEEYGFLLNEDGTYILNEDGSRIKLEENNIASLKLIRRKFGYSANHSDGVLIWQRSSGTISAAFTDRFRGTETTSAVLAGATSIQVLSADGFTSGLAFFISEGTTTEALLVDYIVENTIYLQSPTINAFGLEARVYTNNVEKCTPYYYTLFVNHDTLGWVTDKTAKLEVTTGNENYFTEKLFQLMPAIYSRTDQDVNTNSGYLEYGADSTGEDFDIGLSGTRRYGPMERYLKVIGYQLDQLKALLDCIPTHADIDKTQLKFINGFARLLGFDFNYDMSSDRQRKEIKQIVQVYKRKGTKDAIFAFISDILGIPSQIKEWRDNIICTNDEERTTLEFSLTEESNIGTVDDVIYYVPDFGSESSEINPFNYTVYFDLSSTELTEAIVKKILSRLPEYSPICTTGFVQGDISIEEPITLSIVDSESHSVTTINQAILYFSGNGAPNYADRTLSNPNFFFAPKLDPDVLLQEDGFAILQEDGSYILL